MIITFTCADFLRSTTTREASCTPLSTSLIGDYFNPGTLATALGVYSFSLYGGIGLAYGVGNFAMDADRWNQGWRWAFYYSGIFGLLPAALVYFTVKESRLDVLPDSGDRKEHEPGVTASRSHPNIPVLGAPSLSQLQTTCRFFLSPPLLMICLAGSIRSMGKLCAVTSIIKLCISSVVIWPRIRVDFVTIHHNIKSVGWQVLGWSITVPKWNMKMNSWFIQMCKSNILPSVTLF